jgi:hypothetical protein
VHGLQHILAVGLISFGVSGCFFLDLLLGGPGIDPEASFPPFPLPSSEATFSTGSATVVRGGETIVLDELVPPATLNGELGGTKVTWTDGEGLYLTYLGYPDMGMIPDSSYLSMDWIADNRHWLILDPSRCVTTTETEDATGVVGRATCRGLEWVDWSTSMSGMLPQAVPGQPAFDAEITFEAH